MTSVQWIAPLRFIKLCLATEEVQMTPTNVPAAAQAATPLTPQTGKTDLRQPKAEPTPNSDFYQLAETSQSEGLLLEASYLGLCAVTEDKTEGTPAFLEKHAPRFHGR
jgi:hypothetical protein